LFFLPYRRRGRPPSTPQPILSVADHSYDGYDDSSLSADDIKGAKYRRMRDLNNEASKRCRQNRKRKFGTLIDSESDLRERNAELKMKCKQMEELVERLKNEFIGKVSNPMAAGPSKPKVDLEKMLAARFGESSSSAKKTRKA
jgi:hypothetical protein